MTEQDQLIITVTSMYLSLLSVTLLKIFGCEDYSDKVKTVLSYHHLTLELLNT